MRLGDKVVLQWQETEGLKMSPEKFQKVHNGLVYLDLLAQWARDNQYDFSHSLEALPMFEKFQLCDYAVRHTGDQPCPADWIFEFCKSYAPISPPVDTLWEDLAKLTTAQWKAYKEIYEQALKAFELKA